MIKFPGGCLHRHYLYVCCLPGEHLGKCMIDHCAVQNKIECKLIFFKKVKKCIIYLGKLGDGLPDSGDELVDHLFVQSLIHAEIFFFSNDCYLKNTHGSHL